MYKESIDELQETWKLFGFPRVASKVGKAYAVSGYWGAEKVSLKELELLEVQKQFFAPEFIAGFCVELGDKDRAFAWLGAAYDGRDGGLAFLNANPVWDPIRSDPRFKDLVRRVGLPEAPKFWAAE